MASPLTRFILGDTTNRRLPHSRGDNGQPPGQLGRLPRGTAPTAPSRERGGRETRRAAAATSTSPLLASHTHNGAFRSTRGDGGFTDGDGIERFTSRWRSRVDHRAAGLTDRRRQHDQTSGARGGGRVGADRRRGAGHDGASGQAGDARVEALFEQTTRSTQWELVERVDWTSTPTMRGS